MSGASGAAGGREGDPRPPAKGRSRQAAGLAALALLIGFSAWAMQAVLGHLVPGAPYEAWGGVFRFVEAQLFLGLVAIAYAAAHRWPVEGRQHWRRAAAQAVVGAVASLAVGAVIQALAPTLRPWRYKLRGGEITTSAAKDALFGYALAAGLAYGVVRLRTQRARQIAALEARRRATAAQLNLLALDLQPDAMLRTMDALTELIPRDPSSANEGLVLLATSLSATLDALRAGGVPLAQELAHVDAVLRLHALTTGQQVACTTAVAGAEAAVVPPRILTGAVEAVLAASPPGDRNPLAIAAARDGTQLVVTIRVAGDVAAPPAVVDWAQRQRGIYVKGDVEAAADAGWHGRDRAWALVLRLPWRDEPTAGPSVVLT